MNYQEYGKENTETLILLHGGGFSWWNYREAAELLQDDYHVVLPVLDGHAGSGRPFTTIEDNAKEIIAFIDDRFGGSAALAGGLSLGGQVLLEILSQRPDICAHALVESAMVIPAKITNAVIGPAFSSSYGLIRNRTFARLQFESYHLKPELFEDYYRDSCLVGKEDMIAFMKANTSYQLKDTVRLTKADVHVFAGEKEISGILRSARLIHEKIPGSSLHILPGMRHGEFSMNYPEQYAEAVRNILRES